MAEPTRRAVLAALGGGIGMAATGESVAWDHGFSSIDGGPLDLAAYKGRVLLVANTASFCGYTYQYEALESLHAAKSAAGLTVIGVPSGDFNQESADDATVKTFCETRFGIAFPLASITHVRGPDAASFYAWVKAVRGWEPAWNFNKVLIGRDGRIAGTFGSADEPNGPALSRAITIELEKPGV
jgi:glutathione peroxidase